MMINRINVPQSLKPPTPLSQCVAAKSLIVFLLILITMYHMKQRLTDFLFYMKNVMNIVAEETLKPENCAII